MMFRTRFAPSPTGPLHLGHAYSAILAHDMARASGGEFLLRVEDIDQTRCRAEWEAQILHDLSWLGLTWPEPIRRQSDHLPDYRAALERLWRRGLVYPCTCNRRDIEAAIAAPQEGVSLPTGPDGIIYPGTCRMRPRDTTRPLPEGAALRLDMARALAGFGAQLGFTETGTGPNGETGKQTFNAAEVIQTIGDVVLARRDMGTSYHLSVVLDDAAQGISHVLRGADLFDATRIHVVLQMLLGLPRPVYHHHRLIRDETGKRLAKRDDARAISTFRDQGATPQDIRAMLGL